jgi:hypothetical protein
MSATPPVGRPTARLRRAAAATALVFVAACATQPPSAAERAAFGDVGVEVIAAPPANGWSRPVTGWPAGLGMGAVRGAGAVVVFPFYALAAAAQGGGGGGEGGGLIGVVAIAVGVAAGVVWAPVSVVGGAVTAPSPEVIDAAEPVIRRVLDDPGLWETLGARFAQAARSATGRDLVTPSKADTVVQVRLESIERGSAWNWWTFDRPFEIVVEANVRVVRREDGRVLWEDTRKSDPGNPPRVVRKYADWATDDGAVLHREVDSAIDQLARGFAYSIFAAPRRNWLGAPVDETKPQAAAEPPGQE